MKKLFALYLMAAAVAMVGFSLYQFGFTPDDATTPLINFANGYSDEIATTVVILISVAILLLLMACFFLVGIYLFVKLLYPGLIPAALGAASGLLSFNLVLSSWQGSFADLLDQPMTASVAAFWGFIILAVFGRWLFLPKQKPQADKTADND